MVTDIAETFDWVDPSGTVTRLSDLAQKVGLIDPVSGRFMPPIRRTDATVPGSPGRRLRSNEHDQREIIIGLFFDGTDYTTTRDNLRAWAGRLDPVRGEGILRVTGPGGDTREIVCAYSDGFQLLEDESNRLHGGGQLAAVTFEAADPYWRDTVDTSQAWTAGDGGSFFPFSFPFSVAAGQVFSTQTVTVDSDAPETWPVWTIQGPGSNLVVQNQTTSREFAWQGTLAAGELLIVDTRPGNQSTTPKTVLRGDGTNEFGALSEWDLFPLLPGDNDIQIEFDAITADTQVSARWRNRWLTV